MKRVLVAVLFLAPLLLAAAADQPDSDALADLRSPGVVLRLREDGSLKSAEGPITRARTEDPRAVAVEFVERHGSAVLGGPAYEVAPHGESTTGPSGTRTSFAVTHRGIPVHNAEIVVHVLHDGSVDLIRAPELPAAPAFRAAPRVSQAAAADGVRRYLAARGERAADMATAGTLVWYPDGDALELCWRVWAYASDGAWMFVVSAERPGMTLLAKRIALDEVTGDGRVYMESPKVTKQLTDVDLPHLDSSHLLKGTWARTFNANGKEPFTDSSQMARYTTATSQTDRYLYSKSDKRLTEVMAYYHVTRLKDYLKENKLTTAVNGQIPIIVNVQDSEDPSLGYDNAFFTRDWRYDQTGMLIFGSGEQLHNLAEDSDVIYHEYAHAVIDKIQRGLIQHYEHVFGGAIHEGSADAVSCQMNGNSRMAEWALSYRGTGEFVGRDADNDNRYPDDVKDPDYGMAESHYTGMILSGLFWQMREELGTELPVKLYFDALNRLGADATFFDLRDGLLAAEKAIDGNANVATINSILSDRGLEGDDPGNALATISLQKLQTRHFDWDAWEVGSLSETFAPGSWIALTAKMKIANANPGYYILPTLKIIFPPDIGWGGYEGYYLINEETDGSYEYVVGLLYSPEYAAQATLTWKVKCRLGDQRRYTSELKDTFKIQ